MMQVPDEKEMTGVTRMELIAMVRKLDRERKQREETYRKELAAERDKVAALEKRVAELEDKTYVPKPLGG